MGLDDLRSAALEPEESEQDFSALVEPVAGNERLFGMTAVERMFVSIGCFIVTSLVGFAILLLLDKIAV